MVSWKSPIGKTLLGKAVGDFCTVKKPNGEMELDSERFEVKAGDIINIEDGVFHRVHNTNNNLQLYFVCVFLFQQ